MNYLIYIIEDINELDMTNSNSFLDIVIFIYVNNSYDFIVTVRPIKKLVLLSL